MNGRFATPLVAFALATAVVSQGRALPETPLQLHDPALLGGTALRWLLHVFGFAFILALCAGMTATAVLLCGWRTRVRGATSWYAGLAALLAALCCVDRIGASLAPLGWAFAAVVALALDSDDPRAWWAVVPVVLLWSLLEGGGTFGALLALTAAAGAWLDARRFDAAVRRRLLVALSACVAALVQPRGFGQGMWGARAMHLDAFLPGAQRAQLWHPAPDAASLGFLAILVLAAWYGVRRRARAADALSFCAVLVLALADARNLPLFGIVAAPVLADAVASFYVAQRTPPSRPLWAHLLPGATAVAAFMAVVVAVEPRYNLLAAPSSAPQYLLARLASDGRPHRVLCARLSWCDATGESGHRVRALADDRLAVEPASARRTQAAALGAQPGWVTRLRANGVDAVIAPADAPIVAFLRARGDWREAASDAHSRVLLVAQSER